MKVQDNQLPFLVSGKFGDVIGRVVNGKQYFSKKRGLRRSEPSIRELEIRRNMAIATGFIKPILPLIRKYDKPNGEKGYHKAMSQILRNAMQGRHPDQRIDYGKVVLGEGNIPNPEKYHVESAAKGLLEFSWSWEKMKRGVGKSDSLFVLVYSESTQQFRYELDGPERREKFFLMNVACFSKQRIEVWFGFASPNSLLVSTSIYAGSINIL